MKRYAFDFEGYIYIEAEDKQTAEIIAMGVLNNALSPLHKQFDGDWELTEIEQVPLWENVDGAVWLLGRAHEESE